MHIIIIVIIFGASFYVNELSNVDLSVCIALQTDLDQRQS